MESSREADVINSLLKFILSMAFTYFNSEFVVIISKHSTYWHNFQRQLGVIVRFIPFGAIFQKIRGGDILSVFQIPYRKKKKIFLRKIEKKISSSWKTSGDILKGPYLNYVINHGGGVVVVKMFDRNDKQGIVQDDIDDDPHRGG